MEQGSRSATRARRLTPPRIAVLIGVLVAGVAAALAVPAGGGGGGEMAVQPKRAAAPAKPAPPPPPPPKRHPHLVRIDGVGKQKSPPARGASESESRSEAPAAGAADTGPSPGAPSDAQVRADLNEARAELANFKRHLATAAFLQTGPRARVLPSGMAVAPRNAPGVVKRVILAGNEIARLPYKWGGGHGAWRDSGYDCSGSVSFALAGAGLLDRPLTSGEFMSWGDAGPGRWITLYANSGHIFMVVAGLRFDTSGQGRAGTRWQAAARPVAGFAVRHPPGL
jgi:cell wall-associated NlpC family hydrolase